MHSLPSRHETPTVKRSASQESSSTRPEIIVLEPSKAFAANEAGLGGIKCLDMENIWNDQTGVTGSFKLAHVFFVNYPHLGVQIME